MIRMRSHTSEQQPLSCCLSLLHRLACMSSTPRDILSWKVPAAADARRLPPCKAWCAAQRFTRESTALCMTEGTGALRNSCAVHRYLRNITIPSAFITKSDGQTLKDLFKKSGSAQVDDVYVVLDWNDVLPRAQRVSNSS